MVKLFPFTIRVPNGTQSETTTTEEIEPVLFRISQSSDSNDLEILKRVQDDMRGFMSDSNGNAIPDKASSAGSVVASSFCLSGMTISTVALSVLAICIFTITPVFSAFQCVECPENHYCKSAEKYACPADTPVTATTGAKSDSECMTCNEKYNNNKTPIFFAGECISCYESSSQSANPTHIWHNGACTTCAVATEGVQPIYDDTIGGCISCEQENPETPFWDGEKCVSCDEGSFKQEITCAEGTEWNEETQQCEETVPEGAFIIPTSDEKSFYIAPGTIFKPEAVSEEECIAMVGNSKYPEVTSEDNCNNQWGSCNSSWAGAVKQCRDAGKRLPTKEEMVYLARVAYGKPTISLDLIKSGGDESYDMEVSVANQELFTTLLADNINTIQNKANEVFFWAQNYCTGANFHKQAFSPTVVDCTYGGDIVLAFCVDD